MGKGQSCRGDPQGVRHHRSRGLKKCLCDRKHTLCTDTHRQEKQGMAAGGLRRKVAWFLVWFLFTLQGSNLEMIPSKLKVLLKNCKILPLSGETHVFVRMHFSEFWLSCFIWEFPGHLSGILFSLWPDLPLKAKTSPINLWTPFRLYTMSCI